MNLLLDADVLCYRVGFACEEESVETALMTMGGYLSDILVACPVSGAAQLFLSGRENFRNDIAVTAPYKGNRDKLPKPQHLSALREYLVDTYNASVSEGQEADDDIAIEASKAPNESVIISVDKDFLQVSTWHYNPVRKTFCGVSPEDGLLWFYRQILIGDRVDNVIGAEGIGEAKSLKLLEGLTETEMYQVCCNRLGKDRVLENGRLLWLRREPNQIWESPDV